MWLMFGLKTLLHHQLLPTACICIVDTEVISTIPRVQAGTKIEKYMD